MLGLRIGQCSKSNTALVASGRAFGSTDAAQFIIIQSMSEVIASSNDLQGDMSAIRVGVGPKDGQSAGWQYPPSILCEFHRPYLRAEPTQFYSAP